jgi:hypothetical protein
MKSSFPLDLAGRHFPEHLVRKQFPRKVYAWGVSGAPKSLACGDVEHEDLIRQAIRLASRFSARLELALGSAA